MLIAFHVDHEANHGMVYGDLFTIHELYPGLPRQGGARLSHRLIQAVDIIRGHQ